MITFRLEEISGGGFEELNLQNMLMISYLSFNAVKISSIFVNLLIFFTSPIYRLIFGFVILYHYHYFNNNNFQNKQQYDSEIYCGG
jgi:hypothetical protein